MIQIIGNDDYTEIQQENGPDYELTHDEYSGDWAVVCEQRRQQWWLLDKESAMAFVLEECGVLADADYERAHERC